MEIAEILRRLEWFHGKFEREAVEAAVARREEITPGLLRIMEDIVERAVELDAQGGYMAHLYAMFLLAQFRETRALPLVLRFALLPGELLESLCGDFLTDDLHRVVASVCGGEIEGIKSLIENEDAADSARILALSSLTILVATGQRSRDEIVSYFGTLFQKLPRRRSNLPKILPGKRQILKGAVQNPAQGRRRTPFWPNLSPYDQACRKQPERQS